MEASKISKNSVIEHVMNVRKAIATGDYRVVNKARENAQISLGLKNKVANKNKVQQKAVPVPVNIDQVKSVVAAKVKAM